MRHATRLLDRMQLSSLNASSHDLQRTLPAFANSLSSFHTSPAQAKVEGDKATGYGSSQVEQDRTGGKPQGGGPKPTEHGTLERPGIPSRESLAGRDADKTRPRTGTTGGDPNKWQPGKTPPGYDKDKVRQATAKEQGVTEEFQGNQGVGHLGSDPTKDTSDNRPDYGKADPQKGEEELFQGGNQRQEQGRAGNVHNVDSGETAGMPKEQKPPSSSPVEHHEDKRAAQGKVGSGDSWDPSSTTPSLDKAARVTDPRTPREERSGLSPTDGPPEGSPEPGSYEAELTENVRVDQTPESPQEIPAKVPSAINPQQAKGD